MLGFPVGKSSEGIIFWIKARFTFGHMQLIYEIQGSKHYTDNKHSF